MTNEVLNTIKKRRSIRVYKRDPVAEEALNAVLEAGTFAPTGGGKQSPVIIAITSPEYRKKIQELNAEIMGQIMIHIMVHLLLYWFWLMEMQVHLLKMEVVSWKI